MTRNRRSGLAALAAGLALLLAGCGGGDEASPTPETVVGTVPTETEGGDEGDLPALALEGNAENGKQLFGQNGCGGCHTLEAAGSTGNVGPNLDESKPDFELAVDRVTHGKGTMPAFEDQLSEEDINNVAAYVVESTGGS